MQDMAVVQMTASRLQLQQVSINLLWIRTAEGTFLHRLPPPLLSSADQPAKATASFPALAFSTVLIDL